MGTIRHPRLRPGRVGIAFGLVVVFVAVPVKALAAPGPGSAATDRAVVAVAPGVGPGGPQFEMDRAGRVTRVSVDGTRTTSAELGHYSTPFATSVGGRAVFGGSRCVGSGPCDERVAEVVILDRAGRVDVRVAVASSDGWPTLLNGLALAASDTGGVWVNGAGQLHRVAVPSGEVVERVPWPGGEPCVIGGTLYDLVASGGSYDTPGWTIGHPAEPYQLDLLRLSDGEWQPVVGAVTTMPEGQNAYCVGGGYEIGRVARWQRDTGWRAVDSQPSAAADVPGGRPGEGIDHYNLCSAACGPGVRPHSRDVVVGLADRNRPAALSLNEACYDDSIRLADRLPGLSVGAGYSALDTAVGCPGAVKRFGNVVLADPALRPGPASAVQFAVQAHTPCDHRVNECRGRVCLPTDIQVVCTAHLESPRRAPGVAAAQAEEYVGSVESQHADAGERLLAGDFNLDRSEADAVMVPAGYRSADGEPDQIDLIYDDRPTANRPLVTTTCAGGASDHCHLSTTVTVR